MLKDCPNCGEEVFEAEMTNDKCSECSKTTTVNKRDLEVLISYSLTCTQFLFDAGYEGKSQSLAAKANILANQLS